jgi:hypothetical protein
VDDEQGKLSMPKFQAPNSEGIKRVSPMTFPTWGGDLTSDSSLLEHFVQIFLFKNLLYAILMIERVSTTLIYNNLYTNKATTKNNI